MDAVPLDELVGGGVGPEVIRRLHLGVFQGTGPHCRAEGLVILGPYKSALPSTTRWATYCIIPLLRSARIPQGPAKVRNKTLGATDREQVSFDGGG